MLFLIEKRNASNSKIKNRYRTFVVNCFRKIYLFLNKYIQLKNEVKKKSQKTPVLLFASSCT